VSSLFLEFGLYSHDSRSRIHTDSGCGEATFIQAATGLDVGVTVSQTRARMGTKAPLASCAPAICTTPPTSQRACNRLLASASSTLDPTAMVPFPEWPPAASTATATRTRPPAPLHLRNQPSQSSTLTRTIRCRHPTRHIRFTRPTRPTPVTRATRATLDTLDTLDTRAIQATPVTRRIRRRTRVTGPSTAHECKAPAAQTSMTATSHDRIPLPRSAKSRTIIITMTTIETGTAAIAGIGAMDGAEHQIMNNDHLTTV
jgi:hypothetical protein